MRIRKPHRNTSFRVVPAPEDDDVRPNIVLARPLLKGRDCDGDDGGGGRQKSTSTSSTTSEAAERGIANNTATPESVSTLQEQEQQQQLRGPHHVAEEGSSADQLWQQPAPEEHVTRHYVRRSNVARNNNGGGATAPGGQLEPAMAAAAAARLSSLEMNGNEGIKQGEDKKIAMPPPAIGATKRKQREDSETDSEDRETHLSTAPEGSLLHTLYLQLLAAGSEGITLRELFASFKKQTALRNFASDWKEQVRSHLKSNPHVDEVKGHYLLVQQLPKRSPAATVSLKHPSSATNTAGRHVPSPRTTNVQSPDSAPPAAAVQPPLSVEKLEGVQTRRKAYEKTIEAVLTESAMEFEKMQQSLASSVTTRSASTPLSASRKRKSTSDNEELDGSKTIRGSLQALQAKILAETGVQNGVPCARKDDARKWRCPLMAMDGHTLCEHHKALQLKKRVRKQQESKSNLPNPKPETGRVRNRRLKSDATQGSVVGEAPEMEKEAGVVVGAHAVEALMDLQGQQPRRTVSLTTFEADSDPAATNQVEEEAESEVHTATPADGEPGVAHSDIRHPKTMIPGSLKALQAKIVAESGVQSGVRCARKDGSNDSARKWQCPMNAMEGHTLCEHHNTMKEKKRARYAAAKQTKAQGVKPQGQHSNASLPESHTQFDAAPASLPPRSEGPSKPSEKDVERLVPAHEKADHTESTETDEDHNVQPGNSKQDVDDDDANAERLLPHTRKSAPKRWYVAAKKTAAVVDVVKEKSQERETSPLIRPPTIPPLPAMYGIRRKTVKNRSLLSL